MRPARITGCTGAGRRRAESLVPIPVGLVAVGLSRKFTFNVKFSTTVSTKYKVMRDDAGRRVHLHRRRDHRSGAGQQARDYWKITVDPHADDEDVVITLPETTDCSSTGAICSDDNDREPLSRSLAATVTKPAGDPVTASFSGMPDEHDGKQHVHVRPQLQRGHQGRVQAHPGYFPHKLPVALDRERATFVFVQVEDETVSEVRTWGGQHAALWAALAAAGRAVEVVVVGPEPPAGAGGAVPSAPRTASGRSRSGHPTLSRC